MQLQPFFKRIENGIHSISRALHQISKLVLFLLMAMMFVDVVSRYVFGRAITGSIDFVVLMMAISIFLSFPDATWQRTHVRTDILYQRLSQRKQAVLDVFTIGLSAIFALLISWQLCARAIFFIYNPPGLSTAYFSWPHFPFIFLGAICFGLVFLELIIWMIQALNKSI